VLKDDAAYNGTYVKVKSGLSSPQANPMQKAGKGTIERRENKPSPQ
jgi:hypothetical protein